VRASTTAQDCDELCVETLTRQLFEEIVASCGANVGQVQEATIQGIRWRIDDNFENHSPWSWMALGLSAVFVLLSFLYDRTVGRVVDWIPNG
jgi:hypothetical protein